MIVMGFYNTKLIPKNVGKVSASEACGVEVVEHPGAIALVAFRSFQTFGYALSDFCLSCSFSLPFPGFS